MGLYQNYIVPWLTHLSMQQAQLVPYRKRVVSRATGQVLEIGIGSGLNLPFYSQNAEQVIGIDPSPKLLEMADEAARHSPLPVELIEGSAEAIPIGNTSIDTVVTTWTMCSIPNLDQALEEVRRVLRPGGRLLFVEHGLAPEPRVRWWQDHLTPGWKHLSGGCHLNRAIGEVIKRCGFSIEHLDKGYLRGPKIMTFMYEGRARPL
jgi:ubiquinone/menaquinone biosynthesis C-methylase UbiE